MSADYHKIRNVQTLLLRKVEKKLEKRWSIDDQGIRLSQAVKNIVIHFIFKNHVCALRVCLYKPHQCIKSVSV